MKTASALAPLLAFACAQVGESDQPGLEDREALTFNALTFNALTFNALSANFDANGEMVTYALATESYDGRVPALENQLSDDLTQEFMHYLVGCALKPGQVVEYKDKLFSGAYNNKWEGELGLCPEWYIGSADQNCQEVVSACLLSRVNAFGISVELSMRGHDAYGNRIPLGATEELDFPWREGAFYGDIFEPTALADGVDIYVGKDGKVHGRDGIKVQGAIYTSMFSCVSSVWTYPEALSKDRICAGGGVNCAATNVGACRYHQTFNPTYRCGYHDDPATGYGNKDYQNCKDLASPTPKLWKNAITVFLDSPCALYPKGKGQDACKVTERNLKYGPTAWDAYDAKGQKQ